MEQQPIVINLNSLIDKVIIVTGKEVDTNEIQKAIKVALLTVTNAVTACNSEIHLSDSNKSDQPG